MMRLYVFSFQRFLTSVLVLPLFAIDFNPLSVVYFLRTSEELEPPPSKKG